MSQPSFHPTKGSRPETVNQARWQRKNPSPPERAVWEWVRDHRMLDLKFRRQCPLGDYTADFYCHKLRLVLEVDGSDHGRPDRVQHDLKRDAECMGAGLRVVRVSARSVLQEPERTRAKLERLLMSWLET